MLDVFNVTKIFLLATAAFIVTILWTPLLTHYLYKYRAGKRIRNEGTTPVFSQLHQGKAGTPTMGGVLIWGTTAVLAVALFLAAELSGDPTIGRLNFLTRAETLLPLGALVASALIGLLDDIYNVRAKGTAGGGLKIRHKLLIYAVIAAVGAWWFYDKLDWTQIHVPFVGNFDIGLWYIPVFLFIIVATSFSVNEIDGLDGLAGGTLLAAFAAFGAIAWSQGKVDLATFCGVIIGALLAFLWFNIPPARFFMGDTGSMALGVTLGIVAMLTNSVLLLPVIGFLFVVESCSVILQLGSRKFRGRKVFKSAPIHHHLEAIGWPESKIVMRFWVIGAVMGLIGLMLALVDRTF